MYNLSPFLHPSALDQTMLWSIDYREVMMMIAVALTSVRHGKITTGKQIFLWRKNLYF